MKVARAGGRLAAVIALALAVLLLAPAESRAWVCGMPQPEEALDHSSHVFRGVLVSVRTIRQGPTTKQLGTFRVREYWKGDVEPTMEVRIDMWFSNDPIRMHGDYLVFASRETYSGWLAIAGCKSGPWETRKYLVEPYDALRVSYNAKSPDMPAAAPWVPLAALLAVTGGVGTARLAGTGRRRRP
jgi:hypothetical protein